MEEEVKQEIRRPFGDKVSSSDVQGPLFPVLLHFREMPDQRRSLLIGRIVCVRLPQQSFSLVSTAQKREEEDLLEYLLGIGRVLSVASLVEGKSAFVRGLRFVYLSVPQRCHAISNPSLRKLWVGTRSLRGESLRCGEVHRIERRRALAGQLPRI